MVPVFFSLSLLVSFAEARPLDFLDSEHREVTATAEFDRFYEQRGDFAKAEAALAGFAKLLADNPLDREVAWRFAMASYFVGHRVRKESKEKEALFEAGVAAGKKVIEADTTCAPCFFWTGINLALLSQTRGKMSAATGIAEVRDMMKKANALDPTVAFAGPYRLLGIIDRQLPGLLGGSNARSREEFEKAIAIAPDEPLNRLELAHLLADEMDKPAEALEVARAALVMVKPDPTRFESLEALEEINRFARELELKLGEKN